MTRRPNPIVPAPAGPRRLSQNVHGRLHRTPGDEDHFRRWMEAQPAEFRQGFWAAVLVLDDHVRIEQVMRQVRPIGPRSARS